MSKDEIVIENPERFPSNVTSIQKKIPLDRWIADAITNTEFDAKISVISLVHLKGESEVDVDHVKFNNKAANFDPKALAKRFKGKAEQFVQDMPGVHTFCLLAFYGGNEVLARQPFRVNVAHDYGSLGTEAPNETGKLQAEMRRNDMTFQQLHMKQVHQDNFGLRLLDRYENMNQILMRQVGEMFEINQNLSLRIMELTHNKEMEKLKFMYDRQERNALLKMAPPLLNTIAGGEVFPQASEDTAIVEAIAEEITPEMLGMLDALMPTEKAAVLKDRLNRYHEKKRQEEEAARNLPIFKGSAKDDIGGGPDK